MDKEKQEINFKEKLALFNVKTKEIVSRCLTSDMIDYEFYGKNKIQFNWNFIKVIENPLDNEIEIKENGSLNFKKGYEPKFMGINY